MNRDVWGEPLDAADEASTTAWNRAWQRAMHFTGDPFEVLAQANDTDSGFAMGSVFCGVYRVLGGSSLDASSLRLDLDRAQSRAHSDRERSHTAALELLVAGNFTAAAKAWDALSAGNHDFAAVRFAHDVYLHVGDAARRLWSSQRAMDRWSKTDPWWSFVAGQHAFSLEEAGFLSEAELLGHEALEADPLDLWALHALAHVYETTEDRTAALSLLRGRHDTWSTQDQLSVHIWWHLALRLIADGEYDEVLQIHDDLVPTATTPFRLCDLVSLLWRLELEGVSVGDRWAHLAEMFASRPERHTTGFLDLHAAMAFTRQPNHPAASAFFEGVDTSHARGSAEIDDTFRRVVSPLVEAIRTSTSNKKSSAIMLKEVEAQLHRIGGSVAQRDIVGLTRNSIETTILEKT